MLEKVMILILVITVLLTAVLFNSYIIWAIMGKPAWVGIYLKILVLMSAVGGTTAASLLVINMLIEMRGR